MYFYLNSFSGKKRVKHFYNSDEVDIFIFYCIENGFFGLAKFEEIPQHTFTINTTDGSQISKNNLKKIRFIKDFELDKKLKEL